MQRLDLSMEMTEGEVTRIAEKEKSMGLQPGQLVLAALVLGLESFGIDVTADPLQAIADDLGDDV
jgi:hypothetical protein